MPTEPAGTLPADLQQLVNRISEAYDRCEIEYSQDGFQRIAEAAFAAGQAAARGDEEMMVHRLSDILTGGNAGTWDELAHAAEQAAASSPRPSGEGEGGRP